jgi:HEAT repeat protein
MGGLKHGTGANPGPLMEMLASGDGSVRLDARESLVALGKSAVSSLSSALNGSRSRQVRWEAAKALGAIRSPRSIAALAKALEDRDRDVAWLAAEALKEFGQAAWPAVFRALIDDGAKSALLRQGVHHVLGGQEAALVTASEIFRRLKATPIGSRPRSWGE